MEFHLLILILSLSLVRGHVCSRQTVMPDHASCGKYIVCQMGVAIEKDCTEGYHFDIFSKSCQPASVATCILSNKEPRILLPPVPNTLPAICYPNTETTLYTTIVTTRQTTEVVMCRNTEIGYLPNLKHCSLYYVCLFGIIISRKCPHGLEFSPAKRTCLPKNIAGCMSTLREPAITNLTATVDTTPSAMSRPVCDMTKIGYLPDFNDCRYYYFCLFGALMRKMCPYGYLFSTFVFNCLPEDQVICPVITKTIDSTTQYTITTQTTPFTTTIRITPYRISTQTTPPTTLPAIITPSSTTQMSESVSALPQCTDLIIWTVVDSTDCAYYYTCVYGTLKRKICKTGYYFDSDTLVCLPQNQVNCNPTVVSSPPIITIPYTTSAKTTPSPITTQSSHSPSVATIPSSTTTQTNTPTYEAITQPTITHTSPQPITSHATIEFITSQPPQPTISVYSDSTTSDHIPSSTIHTTPKSPTTQTEPTGTETIPPLISTQSVSMNTEAMLDITVQTTPDAITVQTTPEPIFFHTTSHAITTPRKTTDSKPYSLMKRIQFTPQPLPRCTDEDIWIVSDAIDCKYFYACVLGIFEHVKCEPEHYFDSVTLDCLPKDKVIKSSSTMTITTPEATITDQTTKSLPPLPPTTTESTALPQLPECGEYDIWMSADPLDCANYYVCVLSYVELHNCQEGYKFDSVVQECLPENDVNCTRVAIASQTSTRNIISTSTVSATRTTSIPILPTTPATITKTSTPPITNHDTIELITSQSPPQSTIMSSDHTPQSTTIRTTPQPITTPENLHPITPEQFIFQMNTEPATTEGSISLVTSQNIPQPIDAQSTPQAFNTHTTQEPITFKTTSYTITTPSTTMNSNPSESNKPIEFPQQHLPRCTDKDVWIVSDYTNCTYYYACILGDVKHVKCQPGLYFDSITLDCLPKDEVDCKVIPSSSTMAITTPEATITDQTTTPLPATTESTILPQIPECGEYDIWMSADPLNCANYYVCVLSYIELHHCQEGYKFDSVIQECLPENEVNCTSMPMDSETSTISIHTTPNEITTDITHPTTAYPIRTSIKSIITNTKPIPYRTTTETPQFTISIQPTKSMSTQNAIKTTHLATNIKPYMSSEETTQTKMNVLPITTKMVESTQSATISNPSTIITETAYPIITTTDEPVETDIFAESTPSVPPMTINTEHSNQSTDFENSTPVIAETTYSTMTTPNEPIKTTVENIPATTPDQIPSAIKVTDTHTSTTTQFATLATPLCERSDVWFSPDQKDCKLYYICLFGVLEHNECPKGYHFSPQVLKCLPKFEANCTIVKNVATPNINLSTSTTQSTTTQSKLDYYTTMCKPNASWLWPDRYNCSFYYLCLVGSLKYMKCDNGYHFSTIELKCLPVSQAQCNESPTIMDNVSITDTTQQATTELIKSNTTMYSSMLAEETTPSTISRGISAKNTLLTTILAKHDRLCNDLDVWITFDPDNCRFYYICIHGALRHRQCPFVFYFDPKKRECLPRHIVKCNDMTFTTNESEISKLMPTTPSTITTPDTTTYFTTLATRATTATEVATT